VSKLKDLILENMTYQDYRQYFEQELGEIGKLNSSGWATALCCFHNDTDPSLNINFFRQGAWKCHGCSESGDLFSFHMKKYNVDFKETLNYFCQFLGIDPANVKPVAVKKKSKPKKKKPLGEPSKVYQYIDLTGKVRIETCRYDNPKDFRQRRPHPTKSNEYLWNLKDVEHIPYNLKAVVEAETVDIVEGERDCDRLSQIGLTATTNALGAGKWFDSMTPYFKDKVVRIFPDNDDPGRQHAELVAGKLKGTAKSIQIVPLPNLSPGEDVSNWLDAGNTKADLLEVIKNQKPYENHIDFLNKCHAIISINGRTCILNEETDPIFNRETVSFSSLKDLQLKYGNKLIPNPNPGKGQAKFINIVTDWVKSPDRRDYNNIIFSPGNNINGSYNLWKGFAIEPKKGDWSLFREHIFSIIAGGKQNISNWILTWLARIVQDPGGKRSQTSLVLRGDQGVGKGVFISNCGRIFGSHYLQISNPVQLTGRFNNHFQNVLLLFVDEGHWAGDKTGEGIIKGIVTERTLTIEPKGRDVFTIKNHINLAMASNSDWIVPAGLDERRFMVLDVADNKKQDRQYFGAIDKQLKNGGYQALLYDLLKYDTSKVDVTKIINTAAGFDQKIASMDPVQKFWLETLRNGLLKTDENEWSEIIPREEFHNQYLKFCSDIGVRYKLIPRQFGKAIKKLCPGISQRYLTDKNIDSSGVAKQVYHYQFPKLDVCRDAFEQKIGIEINWDTDECFINGEFEI